MADRIEAEAKLRDSGAAFCTKSLEYNAAIKELSPLRDEIQNQYNAFLDAWRDMQEAGVEEDAIVEIVTSILREGEVPEEDIQAALEYRAQLEEFNRAIDAAAKSAVL